MSSSDRLTSQLAKPRPKGLNLNLDKLASKKSLEDSIYDLFKSSFITNCHLDDASITTEEIETLEDLSTEEVLENFKDLINDLLNFKKDFRSADTAELVRKSEQFETMLQKLEAEVRGHIRVEHQLKLHIESNQNKIEELEKARLESEGKIFDYEERLKGDIKNKQDVNKDKTVQKLEIECNKLRLLLEDKVKECEKWKREVEKMKDANRPGKNSASIDFLKKRLEEKAVELGKIQQIMKEKAEKTGLIEKKKRRGTDELSRNTPSPFRSKKETESTWVESRPSTAKKGASRGSHARSNSDQVRPFSSKKLII